MFTDAVQAAQALDGSKERYAKIYAKARFTKLGERETAFLASCTSLYLATTSETGWPYVQHRGGPQGFVKVLGPEELALAEYPGNQQYISQGNLHGDARVSIFAMDYPRQARLKLQGRAEICDAPEILERLITPEGVTAQRALRIRIAALDWNCPKYIEPRYTEAEIQAMIGPKMQEMAQRIADLEAQLAKSDELTRAERDRSL